MADKKDQTVQINLTPDVKILYTDTIFMNVSDDGVTFDICQKSPGPNNSLQIVSRLGMSREHAEKFVKKLSEILVLTLKNPKKN